MWVQDLGLQDLGLQGRPGNPECVTGVAPRILTMDSPFGELQYLAPVAQYSETPAYWDKPPLPLGASRAEWLVR